MRRLFIALLAAASTASAAYIRTFDLVTDADALQNDTLRWNQGESVRVEVTAKRGNSYIALASTDYPVMRAWYGGVVTGLYIDVTGTVVNAGGSEVRVDLTPAQANLPSGAYNYVVSVYDASASLVGTVAKGALQIAAAPVAGGLGYVAQGPWGVQRITVGGSNYAGTITLAAGSNVSLRTGASTITIDSTAAVGGIPGFTVGGGDGLAVVTNSATNVSVAVTGGYIPTNAADGRYVNLTGDTMSGTLTVTNSLDVSAPAGNEAAIRAGSGTGNVGIYARQGVASSIALDDTNGVAREMTFEDEDTYLIDGDTLWNSGNLDTGTLVRTDATQLGAAANGGVNGAAVGASANGSNQGVAIGANSAGNNYGVMIGYGGNGDDNGVAVGAGAGGNIYGIAIGRAASAALTNIAIGAFADASGGNAIAIGYQATNTTGNSALINVPTTILGGLTAGSITTTGGVAACGFIGSCATSISYFGAGGMVVTGAVQAASFNATNGLATNSIIGKVAVGTAPAVTAAGLLATNLIVHVGANGGINVLGQTLGSARGYYIGDTGTPNRASMTLSTAALSLDGTLVNIDLNISTATKLRVLANRTTNTTDFGIASNLLVGGTATVGALTSTGTVTAATVGASLYRSAANTNAITVAAHYTNSGPWAIQYSSGLLTGLTTNPAAFVVTSGVYQVGFSVSFSGTANSTYEVAAFDGGIELESCEIRRKLGAGGDVGSASAQTIFSATNGAAISLQIRSTDGGTTYHPQKGSFWITRQN